MPIKFRITILFSLLVMFILGGVCSGIYYFSYTARENRIKTRLINKARTLGRLLTQKETFNRQIIQKIDSLTLIALINKSVQAYDSLNKSMYTYSDIPGDTLMISDDMLKDIRKLGMQYFKQGEKDVVAYYYTKKDRKIVILTTAIDVDGRQTVNKLLYILIISFFVGSGFVVVFGYLFSDRLMQPIKKITTEVEEISAQNLTKRIDTGENKDEWHSLAETLNKLLDRLQESFYLQRRFISNASHEISTPLAAIANQIQVALQRERSETEYKKVLESINQDVHQLGILTRTLLEVAKASGNVGGLEINKIRIDEILLRLPSEIARLNPKYSMDLEFDRLPEDDDHLFVLGNEALLITAIKNIVTNACKYSKDHRAKVILGFQDKQISISVIDEGEGIPAEELKNIFQPFYRVRENIKGKGFGLGLSLAQKIIKLHNGHISTISKLHEGSRFTIWLPSVTSTL
jgi:two-component system, OmpR family, sensor histidine kinase ArlS